MMRIELVVCLLGAFLATAYGGSSDTPEETRPPSQIVESAIHKAEKMNGILHNLDQDADLTTVLDEIKKANQKDFEDIFTEIVTAIEKEIYDEGDGNERPPSCSSFYAEVIPPAPSTGKRAAEVPDKAALLQLVNDDIKCIKNGMQRALKRLGNAKEQLIEREEVDQAASDEDEEEEEEEDILEEMLRSLIVFGKLHWELNGIIYAAYVLEDRPKDGPKGAPKGGNPSEEAKRALIDLLKGLLKKDVKRSVPKLPRKLNSLRSYLARRRK